MRLRSLIDLDEMLAGLDELAADATADEQRVAVWIVATDLALALPEEPGISHPVGDVVRQPRAALRAVVIRAGHADFARKALIPVHTLRAIRDIEAVLDAEAHVLGLQLVGELVRADVEAAPPLR